MKIKDYLLKAHISSNLFWGICALAAVIFCLILFFVLKNSSDFNIQAELSSLTQNIHKHYQKNPDYRGLNTSFAVQNKIIPLSMTRNDKIYSVSKSEILIGKNIKGESLLPMDRFFNITYLRINKKECLKIAAADFDQDSGLIGITIQNKETYVFTYGGELTLPLSQEEALRYCDPQNTIMFTFE